MLILKCKGYVLYTALNDVQLKHCSSLVVSNIMRYACTYADVVSKLISWM